MSDQASSVVMISSIDAIITLKSTRLVWAKPCLSRCVWGYVWCVSMLFSQLNAKTVSHTGGIKCNFLSLTMCPTALIADPHHTSQLAAPSPFHRKCKEHLLL